MEKIVQTKQPIKIYQIKLTLDDIEPPIWRSFQIRSDAKLTTLHNALQYIVGWDNYHLYAFEKNGIEYGDPDLVDGELEMRNARTTQIKTVLPKRGSKCVYLYDFGDGWRHNLQLEAIVDPVPGFKYPVCVSGERNSPPEDCGGVPGYEDLLRILNNPEDEEYETMKTWGGSHYDPERFDCDIVNNLLSRRVLVSL